MTPTNWLLIATLLLPFTNRVIVGMDTNTGRAIEIVQVLNERRSLMLAVSLESSSLATNYVNVSVPRSVQQPLTNYNPKTEGIK